MVDNGMPCVVMRASDLGISGDEAPEAEGEGAAEKGIDLMFEASVGGCMPIIKMIRESLVGNRIRSMTGILNGTCNYILSKITDEGGSFSEVLAEAQEEGYAEADPTFDVEGIDAAHKLTILASIAFGIPLQFDAVYTEGIGGISAEDVVYAGQLGYRIKHLGVARRGAQGIEMRVHPTLIPEKRLIASVDGVMNAVLVKGDAVGPTLYYGAGAGSLPTASAVVAHIVSLLSLPTDVLQFGDEGGAIGYRIGDEQSGITREFARVLRHEILGKDRRWFLLETGDMVPNLKDRRSFLGAPPFIG